MKAIVALLLLWLAASLLLLPGNEPEGRWTMVFVVVVVGGALASFFTMRYRLTAVGVEAYMFPFTGRATYSEIEDVTVAHTPWYTGWGMRIWGRRLAFVSRRGPAVFIKKKEGFFQTLVLTPENPEQVVRMIREHLP